VNRALRAATIGALLLSPIALTACSAGQVTQTASQNRDKVGTDAQIGDLALRQVTLEYPGEGRYDEGDDVPLIMAIVNGGNEDDALVGIEGEGFDGVVVTGQATSSGSPTAAPSGPATVPSAPTTARASTRVDIPVPAGTTVFTGGDGVSVELSDLAEELTAGQSLDVTLTFERAGEVTVAALVANPDDELPREEEEAFDFHEEEGAEGEAEG
jgi:copper(I)-binding protein